MPYPVGIPSDTYAGINYYLWIAVIGVHFIVAFMVIMKGKHSEADMFRKLLNSYGFFSFALGINRIFFLWAYLSSKVDAYTLGLGIGYIWAAVALVPIIYILEKEMIQNRTHYLFFILSILVSLLAMTSVFLPDSLVEIRNILQLVALLPALIWFFLYIWIIKSTTGSPRKKAIMIVTSVMIALFGFILDSERFIAMEILPPFVAPILYIIGLISLVVVLTKEDKIE